MREQGYKSVDDFIGLGLRYIKPAVDIDYKTDKVYAVIDDAICNGCGRCINHICCATYMVDNSIQVDAEKCWGCGMCLALCPQQAISLHEKV